MNGASTEDLQERIRRLEGKIGDYEAKNFPDYLRTPDGLVFKAAAERTFSNFPLRPELTITTPLQQLRGRGMPQSYRDLRQLAAAVAVARGEPVPGATVPREYVPAMRSLHAARQKGLSWRAALVETGLEPPATEVVAERARALRDDLPALWDGLRPAIGLLRERGQGIAGSDALERVRQLMI